LFQHFAERFDREPGGAFSQELKASSVGERVVRRPRKDDSEKRETTETGATTKSSLNFEAAFTAGPLK